MPLAGSGAGKSSMLGAILRMTDLDSGSIHISNINICHVPLMRLRRAVAYIPQTAFLFQVCNVRSQESLQASSQPVEILHKAVQLQIHCRIGFKIRFFADEMLIHHVAMPLHG